MSNVVDRIVSAQQVGGGTEEERRAAARLFHALFHRQFVELARELRSKNITDVSVFEDASEATLRVGGHRLTALRFSMSDTVTITLNVAGRRLAPEVERQEFRVGAASDDDIRRRVDVVVDGWAKMITAAR